MLIRGKVCENRELASLPMEFTILGRVADTKAALKKEQTRISKVQRNHNND